jgi:hypothetical protein
LRGILHEDRPELVREVAGDVDVHDAAKEMDDHQMRGAGGKTAPY